MRIYIYKAEYIYLQYISSIAHSHKYGNNLRIVVHRKSDFGKETRDYRAKNLKTRQKISCEINK